MPVPCEPDNVVAKKILESCAAHFAANCDDCNKFVKASLGEFLTQGYLGDLNADGIVGKLKEATEGWRTSRDIAAAIAMAKAGNMVIAGMTSAELGQHHGHLAVVVGCDGVTIGGMTMPVGYAGALGNPAARLEGGSLSRTFAAALVRSRRLDYFFKAADRIPA